MAYGDGSYGLETYSDSSGTSTLSIRRSVLWGSGLSVALRRSVLWTNKLIIGRSILWDNKQDLTLRRSVMWSSRSSLLESWVAGNDIVNGQQRLPGIRAVIKNLVTGTEKVLTGIKSWTYQHDRNTPVSWTMVLENNDGRYSARNTGSTYYGWMTTENVWSSSNEIIRVMVVQYWLDGEKIWESPYLVLEGYDAERPATTVTLSGTDMSALLNRENQSLTAQVSAPGDVKTAHGVTEYILKAAKVPAWRLNFPNFPLWKVNVVSTRLMDVLTRIWSIPRVNWWWDKDTLVVDPLQFNRKGVQPPHQELKHGEKLKRVHHNINAHTLINVAEVRRSLEAVQGDVREGITVNNISIDISPPLWGLSYNIRTQWCSIVDGTLFFWDDADPPNFYSSIPSNVPVARISFFLIPSPPTDPRTGGPAEGSTPYWRVSYKGMPVYSDLVLQSSMFDTQYSARVKNATSIAKHGEHKNMDPLEDPNIPNLEWAKYVGKMIIVENRRTQEGVGVTALFDPSLIVPGKTVHVVEGNLFLDDHCLVDSTSHSWPMLDMELACRFMPDVDLPTPPPFTPS